MEGNTLKTQYYVSDDIQKSFNTIISYEDLKYKLKLFKKQKIRMYEIEGKKTFKLESKYKEDIWFKEMISILTEKDLEGKYPLGYYDLISITINKLLEANINLKESLKNECLKLSAIKPEEINYDELIELSIDLFDKEEIYNIIAKAEYEEQLDIAIQNAKKKLEEKEIEVKAKESKNTKLKMQIESYQDEIWTLENHISYITLQNEYLIQPSIINKRSLTKNQSKN